MTGNANRLYKVCWLSVNVSFYGTFTNTGTTYSLHLGVDVKFCSWSHDFLRSAMDGDGSPRHLTAQNFYSAIALQTH